MIIQPDKAADLIRQGEVVAIPTETVYGLAADATNALAVRKTFELKGRPADNPLIVHLSDPDQISLFSGYESEFTRLLTEKFWPGPLTLVLPKERHVLDIVTGGLDTVALRMPDHATARHIIERCGPVTAPSANRSGRPSPTRAEHVAEDFGESLPVVDGGRCEVGIESTVLDLSSETPAILRPGLISDEEIRDCIGAFVDNEPRQFEQQKRSPGTRYTHYKPDAEVKWLPSVNELTDKKNSLYIFHSGRHENRHNIVDFNSDFSAFARSLYDLYRTADQKKWQNIFIEPLPHYSKNPLLPALFNRIQRSASQ